MAPLCPPPDIKPSPPARSMLPETMAEPLQSDDPRHVDVVAPLGQAQRLAEKLQPQVRLVGISATEVVRGTVDILGSGRITYTFEYQGLDCTRPSGPAAFRAEVTVDLRHALLWASRLDTPPLPRPVETRALFLPCTSTKAWAAVVGGGAPAGAMAEFRYELSSPGGELPLWKIDLREHPELHTLEVYALSCTVRGAASAPTAQPSAPRGKSP